MSFECWGTMYPFPHLCLFGFGCDYVKNLINFGDQSPKPCGPCISTMWEKGIKSENVCFPA